MSDVVAPSDLDLLRAAFRPDPGAVEAWTRWRGGTDWDDHVEVDAFALLPRVRRNLERLGADDPLFPRFAGIARQAWVANQREKSLLAERLPFGSAPEMLLLPPTSFLFTDGDAALQHRRDWRLAVHSDEAAAAVRALQGAGWRVHGPRVPARLLDGWVRGADHLPMAFDDGARLSLTWRLDAWFGGRVDAAWRDATTVGPDGRRLRCLQGTDAIEFLLRQPVGGRALRWVGDALRGAGPSIDWAALRLALSERPLVGDGADLLPVLGDLLGDRSLLPTSGPARVSIRPAPPRTSSLATRFHEDWGRYRASWGPQFRWSRAVSQLPGYAMGRWRAATSGELLRGLARWVRYGHPGEDSQSKAAGVGTETRP